MEVFRRMLGHSEKSQPDSRLRAISAPDFLELTFPPREDILGQVIQKQSLVLLHAERGTGKTHVSLGIAYAVSTGGEFLGWIAPKPRGVLLVDGEMPGVTLQERLKTVTSYMPEFANPRLRIITPDIQTIPMPDLASKHGQALIEREITADTELIIFDNLSCLVHSGRENEAESWQSIQEFALRLRARGIAVVFIHHSGKNGTQRGTSRREDILDTVIKLRRPDDYDQTQGAIFEVHFEKSRNLHGDAVSPFTARYTPEDPDSPWKITSIRRIGPDQIANLHNAGKKGYQIAKELGVSPATVSRRLQEAKQGGIIARDGGFND